MNKVCFPVSTLDSPLAGASSQTKTTKINTDTKISDEVCEQTLIWKLSYSSA